MIRPFAFRAKITEKTVASPRVTKLFLDCTAYVQLAFTPGQFVNLKCPGGKYRAYSIASDYKETKSFYLLMETGHDGVASNYVKELTVGETVDFIGPSGMFTLREPLPSHLVFFATGTGIAPFLPMFRKIVDSQYTGKLDLYFGVKTEKDILEHQLLNELMKSIKNSTFEIFLSDDPLSTAGNQGRVTRVLNTQVDKEAGYYVCGHPDMVADVAAYLKSIKIPETQIVTEGFTHSGN